MRPAFPRLASSIRLSELIGALSHALDLTEGQPAGHCVRASFIGTRIGAAIGLDEATLQELRYTVTLKDLGCSSNAARLCQLYLADDLAFKREFKRLDDGLPQVLRFVIEQTGLTAGLAERFRAIAHIFRHGGDISNELIETRCDRGAGIARRLRFSESVASGIHALDEHWDGKGRPAGKTGEAIPLFARIALLSQVADVFHRGAGREAALGEVEARSGRWFDPGLVAAFRACAAQPDFWSRLEGAEADLFPPHEDRSAFVDEDYLDDIAEAFAEVVDSKSPFTSGHCKRVALFTDLICETLGFSADRRRWMKRAALLHDIGKLGVSNTILDKPGPLTDAEFAVMRQHSSHSRTILSQISAFAELAEVGGGHHERLDGKGYPLGLKGDEIGLETRIVTVADIFDALTADRPYRAAMPVSRALAILDTDSGTAVDPVCVEALKLGLARIDASLIGAGSAEELRQDGSIAASAAPLRIVA
ncbi:HD-GYP domain-containing protein [Aureimonas sp. AU40]|uniref:HD-GYP domain-containing protein n=1 Tax=Aureimonas sp. AU40 TaxID=1637747 RepID=UPI00078623EA|nr:HD-GYP domain-containing protein [Aureimonas sp. AU40]